MAEHVGKASPADAFLATVNHELRTPLTGILGMTSVLKETSMTPAQQDYVNVIERCGIQLLELVNDVLDYSKMADGQLSLIMDDVDIRSVIEAAHDVVALRAEENRLSLTNLVHPTVPKTVVGDARRIRQIIVNLLSNAIKFTEQGSVSTEVFTTVLGDDRVRVEVIVSDTGVGIEDVDKVLEPFFQGKNNEGGTGLGLTICKNLAIEMGGDLTISSRVGVGTTIRFWFEAQVTELECDSQEAMRGKVVLAVDDKEANRLALLGILDAWGAEAIICPSANEAMMHTRSSRYIDLVLMDMRLPGTSGEELSLRIQAVRPGIPIVAMSSICEACTLPRVFSAFLTKPVKRERLLSACVTAMVPRPPSLQTTPSKSSMRIVAADDVSTNRDVLAAMLAQQGYPDVRILPSGEGVMRSLDEYMADLVILDIKMPGMDGVTCAREIRRRFPDERIMIAALSATMLDDERFRCFDAGMDAFLQKPIDRPRLVALLDSARASIGRQPQIPI